MEQLVKLIRVLRRYRWFAIIVTVSFLIAAMVRVGTNVFLQHELTYRLWLVFPIGLLLSAVFGIVVQTFVSRFTASHTMQQQLAELATTNQTLQTKIAQHLKIEETLALANRFSDSLLNSLPGLFCVLDDSGRVACWNANFETILGYSGQELAGRHASSFVEDKDRNLVAKKMAEAFEKGAGEAESNLLRKDGQQVPHFLIATRTTIGGRPYLVVTGLDISIRRRMEEAICVSERRYRLFAENASDVIWMCDFRGRFTYFNPAIERFLGYSPEEGLQLSIGDYLTPASFDKVSEVLKAAHVAAETNQPMGPMSFELEHVRKDGSTVWAEVTCGMMRDEAGRPMAIQGVTHDISERKRLEVALRTSERLYRLLAENVSDVIWAIDLTGRLVYLSPSFEQLLGHTPEVGLRFRLDDFLTPQSLALVHRLFQEHLPAIKAGQHVDLGTVEVEQIRKDGSTVWTEVTCSAMHDESGQVVAIQGVTRDVSERKRLEDELRRAKETAEAATQAKSQFLAVMSHEIRTPMTAILGYSDLMLDPQLDAATRQSYLATIRRSGEHLLLLINDILDLSKIEAGKLTLNIRRCNVANVLADVVFMMRPRAEQHGTTLSVEYANAVPETICSDPARLRQALVNLTGNAVKFTEKGSVQLRASFLPAWKDGQSATQIEVIDTGIGIRQEAISRLFQPFIQVDPTASLKYGGTGLGLAISRQIAEALGGTLTAASTFGRGSTFTLTVPTGDIHGIAMLNQPPATSESLQKPELPTGKRLAGVHVLLAEDGADNQRLISTVLRRAGAEVKIAENGRVAVTMAQSESFDVVLMDIDMPVMDGREATRLLRSQDYRRPILAITAATMSEDVASSLAAGCDAHLAKPLDVPHMLDTIERYAGKDLAAEMPPLASDMIVNAVDEQATS
jgi:PAS domain S-box-containing protein